MDMIFMLLIFYLVTSYNPKTSYQEKQIFIPTPKNDVGRSQIVLQLTDTDRSLWLDETASDQVAELEDQFGFLPTDRLNQTLFDLLIEQNIVTEEKLHRNLERLVDQANRNPQANYFVLIRVPFEAPYYRVVDLISTISSTQFYNIRYGCVAGTLEELRLSREIKTVLVEDSQGNRKRNLRIEF